MIVGLLTKPHRALDRLCERYGPVCALGAGPFRMVLVGDPAVLAELFRKPADEFRWRHRFNWFDELVGSSSMLTNDEPEHKRLRSAVQAGFSRERLNRWIPMIVERTDVAVDRLLADTEPDEVVDLEPVLRAIALEVVLADLTSDDGFEIGTISGASAHRTSERYRAIGSLVTPAVLREMVRSHAR